MTIWIVHDTDTGAQFYFSSFEKAQDFIQVYTEGYDLTDERGNINIFIEYSFCSPDEEEDFMLELFPYELDSREEG